MAWNISKYFINRNLLINSTEWIDNIEDFLCKRSVFKIFDRISTGIQDYIE